MNRRQSLLEYLKHVKNNGFISCTELSKVLGVSERSIRSYVSQLNSSAEETIEVRKGFYRLKKRSANTDILNQNVLQNNGDVESRRFLILRSLLKNDSLGVDSFDLAEKLFVSDATIRSDMAVLQKLARPYNLAIRQQNFTYFLQGEKNDKRNLLIDTIRKPIQTALSFETKMQDYLGKIPFSEISSICKIEFSKLDFYPNNYFFQNFLLHLIIVMDKEENKEEENIIIPILSQEEGSFSIVKNIVQIISEKFQVYFTSEHIAQLVLLCDGERTNNISYVKEYINPQISSSLDHAFRELRINYLLDFTGGKFFSRLLLHIQNLYIRAKKGKIQRNISISEIKVHYPILFDIAVSLSDSISRDLDINISEDEITFLALHLGSFLTEQTNNEKKIKTLLCTPNYFPIDENLKEKIAQKFGSDLLLLRNSDSGIDVELIIATGLNIVDFNENTEIVFIREVPKENDFNKIREAITRIKRLRYSKFLSEYLPKLIDFDALLHIKSKVSLEEVFENISSWFMKRKIVNEGYAQELSKREKLSSTSFSSKVAIPHTLKYIANKTKLLPIFPDSEFLWGTQKVILILAISTSPDDAINFNKIFPRIVEVLSEQYNVDYLRNSLDAKNFTERLAELMLKDSYYGE